MEYSTISPDDFKQTTTIVSNSNLRLNATVIDPLTLTFDDVMTTSGKLTVPLCPDEVACVLLWRYVSPILLLIGTIGNSLSVLILLKRSCELDLQAFTL